jgi:hypothetical protein
MKHTNLLPLPFADHDSPVQSRWEACSGFSPAGPGSHVCADCGWLAAEHGAGAVVRRLPITPAKARRPRRLAS